MQTACTYDYIIILDFISLVFNAQNPELTTEYVMFGSYNTHITIPAGAISEIKGNSSYSYIIATCLAD